jgi:hypothetical protein
MKMKIPNSLNDAQAEKIGTAIAEEFMLRRDYAISTKDSPAYRTTDSWRTQKGVARRILRIIQENL